MEALIATTDPETSEIGLRLVRRPHQLRFEMGVNTDYELVLELRRAYRRAVLLGVLGLALFATLATWTITRGHGHDSAIAVESFR